MPQPFEVFCPRCDRSYFSESSEEDALEKAKKHVAEQHPDHDPEWYDVNEPGETGGFLSE